ncbi:MAG: lipoate--protein ligase family protein [Spirochaetes bacterium]|nr:lipoate--protein ligase family protein [Spirochaetota bacterium]
MPITGKRPFRFIYTGENDSATNMAMDEAVMKGLTEGTSRPLFRIYKWNPPTITIGYFQSAEDIDFEQCGKDGIGVVRRLTGGRAVLHWEELTYSILFSSEDFFPFRKKEIFTFIARCLVGSLARLGIDAGIAEKTRGDMKSADCFAAPAQYEVESTERQKLIGSAQTIKDGVVLQHGAIPCTGRYTGIEKYLKKDAGSDIKDAAPKRPVQKSAASLSRVLGRSVSDEELLEALREGFSQHLPLIEGSLTEEEESLTKELAVEKYASRDWMFKR